MEQLLVNISSFSLVTGKTLAVILASIIQFLTWVLCALAGIFGGDFLCSQIYKVYFSILSSGMDMLHEWFANSGFSAVSIVLAILSMIFGLVFYLSIAGVAGSMVTKPEEVGSMQMLFIVPLMISYFGMLSVINGNNGEVGLLWNLFPFTSAMVAPGSILSGTISLGMGVLSLVISALSCVGVMYLSAKVYKAMMFYSGKKLSLGAVLKMALSKES